MRKAPEAFRTISEAADALDTPAHVLRFWESKFTQVKPVKRAGGRRYYRPADIDLLSGIKLLLHDQGMTIRGVQKLLQEKGAKHVASMAPLSGDLVDVAAVPILRIVPNTPEDAVDATATPDAPEQVAAATDMAEDTATAPTSAPAELSTDLVPNDAQPETDDTREELAPHMPPADTAPVLSGAEAESEADMANAPEPDTDLGPRAEPAPNDTAPAATTPAEIAPDIHPDTTGAPEPALAALLDAAAADQTPPRFAKIAHALRIDPPRDPQRFAPALAKLENLVAKLSARAD